MRILFIIFFLLITFICHAQKIAIRLPLLTLIDEVTFPTIQGGIELALGKKLSWYNEAGIKYRKSYYEISDTSFIDSRGFKLKSEIRYYLRGKSKGVYVGFNGFYTKDFHNTGLEYYYAGDTSVLRADNFSAKKIVRSVNLIGGKSSPVGRRFNVEVYSGIGVRFTSIDHDNIEVDHTKDIIRRGPDLNVHDSRIWMDAKAGRFVFPNFLLGVRFGCTFK